MATQNTSATTTKWLWLLAFLFGWPAATQAIGSAASFLMLPVAGSVVYSMLGVGVVLTALAWFVARLAFERGAPKGIWIATALGSAPAWLLIAVATIGTSESPGEVLGRVLLVLGLTLMFAGPPVAMYFAGRRVRATAGDDTLSLATPPAGT